MIRTKTTLVVGAGASCDLQMPSSAELLERIASGYDFYRFGGERMSKDSSALLRYLNKLGERPGHDLEKLYAATERLRVATRLGQMIDTIIEQNDDNPLVTLCGKLAIMHYICQGEAKASLRPEPKIEGELPLLIGDYWLVELGRLITSGVPRSKVEQCFDNLSIVSFNYDRSIEHFLPYALMTAYGMTLVEAQRIVAATLNIVHPYGTIGRLPWQQGEGPDVEWGNDTPWNMLSLISSLRTHGELMADRNALTGVRNAMLKSQRVVFMGFGYHPQNLDVLIDGNFSHNPEVLAAVHQMAGPSQTTVVRMLRRKLGLTADDRLMVINSRCQEFMRDYSMLLES
ncbi:MAG: hypothetical protein ABJA20_06555 [Novosphingobium sp.]